MVCSYVLFMLFGVLRGVKLMVCFTKIMSPPPFLCVLCVLYCGIVRVLSWLAILSLALLLCLCCWSS